MKILCVTEDDALRRRLASFLQNLNHTVFFSGQMEDALPLLVAEAIPVILLDHSAAHLRVDAWLEEVRRQGGERFVQVIMLMERPELPELNAALQAGVSDIVTSPFDDADLLLRVHTAEQILRAKAADARQKKDLTEAYLYVKRDLEMAARIQKSMLPTRLPRQKGIQCCWLLEPSEELAGDVLNVFELPGGRMGFYLIDVSGHGIASALISVALLRLLSTGSAKSLLLEPGSRAAKMRDIIAPAQVAQMLNRQFQVNSEYRYFFTFFYGIIDPRRREFSYVAAGHPGMVRFSRQEGAFLRSHGPPVGCLPDFVYQEEVVPLEPGDRIYIYSDGFIETRNPQRRQIGNQHIFEILSQLQNESLEQSIFGLVRAVNDWRGTEHAEDDISILGIEIEGKKAKAAGGRKKGLPGFTSRHGG